MNVASRPFGGLSAVNLTADDLIAFEDEVAGRFNAGEIKSPIHLSGGNEEELLRIFRDIDIKNDAIFTHWRSHYHCLLKGVPPDELMADILKGRSVSLNFPQYKIFSSGICGGNASHAAGYAQGEKWLADNSPYAQCAKVHCFLGDMSAETGAVHEAMKLAEGRYLPVRWIIEDNELSVGTNTAESWGLSKYWTQPYQGENVVRYRYQLTRPHAGTGKWVNFK